MNSLEQVFSVKFEYKVYFSSGLFQLTNNTLDAFLSQYAEPGSNKKILFVIDEGVVISHKELIEQINKYFQHYKSAELVTPVMVIPGGEIAKNDESFLKKIIEVVNSKGIDRHSYIAAIGGGAVLDLAGFAAAVSHRGIRLIRIPTTVLSQNDSGVGVKNGVNYKGKKNFLGAFVPPVAVFNDDTFLTTLDLRNWRAGIAEAVKVALIKDADFFFWIEKNAGKLVNRDRLLMNELIYRCAELHLKHIASGDPFEMGASRPLDFGHWSAHKLEQLTDFKVLHGEAVALGIALDSVYSALSHRLTMEKAERILRLLLALGFEITHPLLTFEDNNGEIIQGLQEFREHLGGQLTIMLLRDIGKGEEIHEIEIPLLKEAAKKLQKYYQASV
jgi:3-dehydroquinate synthase